MREGSREGAPLVLNGSAQPARKVENEPLEETARRIVEGLSAEALAQLVADWLDGQIAI